MKKIETVATIGRGGFGIVDKVKDSDGTLFARKTFQPAAGIPASDHEKLRKRFKREVKIQEELGGNEIIPVIENDLRSDEPWFLMPLADKTFDEQIAEDRASGAIDIDAIADILNALEFLHEHGYVHRDLNPKNILRHDSHWKLSDLGAVLPPSGRTITLTVDTVIYTERYCAPEQRSDFHKAQPSADVYSFGCILHDIFGKQPRIPYSKLSAPGPVGILIEKCTETKPERRPTIAVLRPMLLEMLVELGGHCKVADKQSEHWLEKLNSLDSWTQDEFDDFARFFEQIDLTEREDNHEHEWVYTLSTPFLTRLPTSALVKIVKRRDGVASAVIEKFCEWARTTSFLFHYADTVGGSLAAIFDEGDAATKALAMTALIALGDSHNRWYVMRNMLRRCSADSLTSELARRLAIEIRTEEMIPQFCRCVKETKWDVSQLAPDLAKLCA